MRLALLIAASLLLAAAADRGTRFQTVSNAPFAAAGPPIVRRVDEVNPDSVPPPWLDNKNYCRPQRLSSGGANPSAMVCDPSSLLSEHQIEQLSEPLRDIFHGKDPYSLVRCPDKGARSNQPLPADATGFRVAVLVVRRMPFDSRTLSTRAEAYAHRVFQRCWLSGNCGASVLLFVSVDDRRMYLQTGHLATNYLNTHQIDTVFNAMTPYMRKQRLFAALSAAVPRIGSFLSHYHGRRPRARHSHGSHHNDPLFFRNGPAWWDLEMSVVVLVLAAFLVCACFNGLGGPEALKRKRDVGELLRKLDLVRIEYVRASLSQYTPNAPAGAAPGGAPDDPTRPWAPTIPSLPPTNDESTPLAPPEDDRASARAQNVHLRLTALQQEYPSILTEEAMLKLMSVTPDIWPNPMTEAFLKRPLRASRAIGGDGRVGTGTVGQYGYDDGDRGAGGLLGTVGGLLAAGGVGALLGSALSGNNNDNNSSSSSDNNNAGYSNIAPGAPPSWYMGSSGNNDSSFGGSGQGAGWTSDVTQDTGRGASWAPGSGGGDDGGNGQGAGWNVDGESGQGASWGDDNGGGDGGGDGDGAGF